MTKKADPRMQPKRSKPQRAGKPAEPRERRRGERLLDIVEQAGKESFPASDPPPWTP